MGRMSYRITVKLSNGGTMYAGRVTSLKDARKRAQHEICNVGLGLCEQLNKHRGKFQDTRNRIAGQLRAARRTNPRMCEFMRSNVFSYPEIDGYIVIITRGVR
jgi:hypothetical protein